MKLANHLVGGTVLTASAASLFFGINVISSVPLLAMTLMASALPDIDHTQSLAGKIFYPISRFVNRRYGHRTLTHGLPLLGVLCGIFSVIENNFFGGGYEATTVFGLAYFFHIFLDMFTISGVKLMYPFQKDAIYVMIGRKDLRIRVDDYKAEAVCMFIFIVMGIGCMPLMKNGFWTTYNSAFAKPQHLMNEYQMSQDLLLVDYRIKKGSDIYEGKGYCIEAKENLVVLIEDEKWKVIDAKEYVIESVVPIHTGKHYQFEATNLISVSPDSLNKLLAAAPIAELNVAATNDFRVTRNGVEDIDRKFKDKFINKDIIFSEIKDRVEVQKFTPDNSHLIRCANIRRKIDVIRSTYENDLAAYQKSQDILEYKKEVYTTTNDLTRKERLVTEIRDLEKEQQPVLDENRIAELQSQIGRIRSEANAKNSEKEDDINSKNRAALAEVTETKFTGILTQIIITDSTALTMN